MENGNVCRLSTIARPLPSLPARSLSSDAAMPAKGQASEPLGSRPPEALPGQSWLEESPLFGSHRTYLLAGEGQSDYHLIYKL